MKNAFLFVLAFAGVCSVSTLRSATFTEDFTADPAQNGWRIFGDTNLFQWNPSNHDLQVTWDSSQPNSYFYRPLGNILAMDDDFQISFDLLFSNIVAGINPAKPDAIEVGIGFLNFDEATSSNFVRAFTADDVAEFDYFPAFVDPTYGPFAASVAPAIISSNGTLYGAFGDYLTMTNDVSYHVVTAYTADTATLVTTVTVTGDTNILLTAVTAPSVAAGDDFRVDTFAIASYSDTGDPFDSLYGQGTVANVVITTPPPPVQNLAIVNSNGVWQAQFTSRTNWLYTLQRTANFHSWQTASATAAGNGATLALQDTNAPAPAAFYRVAATRP